MWPIESCRLGFAVFALIQSENVVEISPAAPPSQDPFWQAYVLCLTYVLILKIIDRVVGTSC